MNVTLFRTAALALLAATLPLHAADRPIDEKRPLKADARLSVDNLAGLVEVEAWDRNELSLTGTLSGDAKALEITGDESSLRILVRMPKIVRNPDPTVLKLKVPAGVTLEVEAVSADIRARGLRGPVDVDSVSGDVTLDVASAEVRAGTVSGDVQLQLSGAREVHASSVSGDVTVRGARGELHGESVSGDMKIEAREVRELEVESVSGDIDLDLELDAAAEVEAETLSGEVRLSLPKLPDGLIEIETFSGAIESTLPEVSSGKDFRRSGTGKGRLNLTSFSGDIQVRQK